MILQKNRLTLLGPLSQVVKMLTIHWRHVEAMCLWCIRVSQDPLSQPLTTMKAHRSQAPRSFYPHVVHKMISNSNSNSTTQLPPLYVALAVRDSQAGGGANEGANNESKNQSQVPYTIRWTLRKKRTRRDKLTGGTVQNIDKSWSALGDQF